MFVLAVAAATTPVPAAEWEDLRAKFDVEVNRRLDVPEGERFAYAAMIPETVPRGQYLVLVDRHPDVQALFVLLVEREGAVRWIGASPVSTGRPGTFDHFETPLGVFVHTLDHPDYRALGTKNKNGIRGYGARGMRVYDFGWVRQKKGWGNGAEIDIRLQLHATDPRILEPRLGTRQSKGCVRVGAGLNRFLDRYGILDEDYLIHAVSSGTPHYMLGKEWAPTPNAGRYMVVVESVRSARPDWAKPPVLPTDPKGARR